MIVYPIYGYLLFWTVPVVWCFETNTVVKNNEQSTTGDRIGACRQLRHAQQFPTRDRHAELLSIQSCFMTINCMHFVLICYF